MSAIPTMQLAQRATLFQQKLSSLRMLASSKDNEQAPPCLLSTLLNPSIFNLQPLQQTQDTVRYRLNQLTVDSIQESQLCFLKKLKKTQYAESTIPKNVPAIHRKKSSETAVTNYIVYNSLQLQCNFPSTTF